MGQLKNLATGWLDLTLAERVQFKNEFHLNVESDYEVETTEVFAGGMCSRTGYLPAGLVFVGYAHKQAQMQMIHYGKVKLFHDDCEEVISGPAVFAGEVGAKRLVEVLEDTLWTTVLVTDADNIEQVIAECTTETTDQLVVDNVHINSSDDRRSLIRGEKST